jgi:hypothetical protein
VIDQEIGEVIDQGIDNATDAVIGNEGGRGGWPGGPLS